MTHRTRFGGLLLALLTTIHPLPAQTPWSDARPDAHAPIGVTDNLTPPSGTVLLSYRFGRTFKEGNLFESEPVTPEEILQVWTASATRMTANSHRPSLQVAVTDELSVRAVLPVVSMRMDHVTDDGDEFNTVSTGVGDLEIGGLYRIHEGVANRAHVKLNLSIPTGSITARDVTAYSSPDATILPYPMQRGTGSPELSPGFSFTSQGGLVSWGVQLGATLHLVLNDRRYRVGDRIAGSGWIAHAFTDWISASARFAAAAWENGRGADPILFFQRQELPHTHEDRQGGRRADLAFGANLRVPSGPLEGHRLGAEVAFPVGQSLDGPQLETDWILTAGWSWGFRLFGGEG